MARPSTIGTFTITFGAAEVLGVDEDLSMSVTFTSSTSAIWTATGQPFLLKPQTALAPLGGSGQAILISPDQAGFTDGLGNGIRNWTYLADISYLDSTGATIAKASKSFTWTTSMPPTIDLDLLVPVTSNAGVVVYVPSTGGGGYDGGVWYDGSAPSGGGSSSGGGSGGSGSTTAVVGSAIVGTSTVG